MADTQHVDKPDRVTVFASPAAAEGAMRALLAAGFSVEQITVVLAKAGAEPLPLPEG